MEKFELKKIWSETHAASQNNFQDEDYISKTLKMNHSHIISKILSDLKLKILGYSLMLIILISLIGYALVYLHVNLSATTLILFTFVGLFFVLRIVSTINRLLVITKTSDNSSLIGSLQSFRKELTKLKSIDFISYLIYFYALAILLTYNYINDIGGIQNLSWNNNIQSAVIIAIIMLLSVPWLIKYQNNQRYKKLYSSLNDEDRFLNDAV